MASAGRHILWNTCSQKIYGHWGGVRIIKFKIFLFYIFHASDLIKVELHAMCIFIFRYEAIIPGNTELIVEYRDKFYFMEDDEKLLKFMK